jgi:Rps23 Pro-64 3,4-dihydroxylase Tpa1-like proline 4-hydroxylase
VSATTPSLRTILRPDLFADDDTLRRIGESLHAGRLLVVPDAIDPARAERVRACLDGADGWRQYEGQEPNFHYRHHNLYERERYPAALAEHVALFGSAASRAFVEQLTGRPCSGGATVTASWYQPGDHSLPHQDWGEEREVAFVWNLTREWESHWGGHFVWCPTGTLVAPTFNTLLVFVVNRASLHFVSAVSEKARGKRLAVSGWWHRPIGAAKAADPTPATEDSFLTPPSYGPPRLKVGAAILL